MQSQVIFSPGLYNVESYWRAGVSRCARLTWEACQAPFSRSSPISFQALKSRVEITAEKEKQRPQSQTPPPAMFQGWAQQEQMGMPVPVAWP